MTITEESRKLPAGTTGPYTVQSAIKSTLRIDKAGVAFLVNLERLAETSRVSGSKKFTMGLQNQAAHPESGMQGDVEKNNFHR